MSGIRTPRIWMFVGALTIAALVAAVNVFNLREAYGDGPPYYSRTTNMDKWADPVPALVVIDAMAVAMLSVCLYWVRRK